MSVPFEIVFDDVDVKSLSDNPELKPYNNKRVLGLTNDFEDGSWRYDHFQDYIWDNLHETALSLREKQALYGKPRSILKSAAKNLKIVLNEKMEKGGEIAEILLYGVMKDYYGALPVVPKIFYKQNPQDPAKGADSVHIVIESDTKFSLWHGEAKFYNSIEDVRLPEILDSVHDICESKNIKKENAIVTSVSDIDLMDIPEPLKKSIREMLQPGISVDLVKPILHIPILLLYECPLTKIQKVRSDDYIRSVKEFQKERAVSYFKKQIKKCEDIVKYDEIKFHLILFPVPDKGNIVSSFRKIAGELRE